MDIDLTKLTAEELNKLGIQVYAEKERRSNERYKILFGQFMEALQALGKEFPYDFAVTIGESDTWDWRGLCNIADWQSEREV